MTLSLDSPNRQRAGESLALARFQLGKLNDIWFDSQLGTLSDIVARFSESSACHRKRAASFTSQWA
ncbi:hypothetical protein [Roseiconus lacunae]|uniref:hypothetical protein n=1 Tax=Roseiconus lacunae TaxID=2605694 RepID=UPI001E405956|nr:hypothetical protein [Roseiconus lacunae]MCD0458994.1 hypothetical protein [Roseiconus lacunae]